MSITYRGSLARQLTYAEVDANFAAISGGGAIVALFCDSMTDWNFNAFTCTSASFDPTTNIMTFQVSSHNTIIGSTYNLYNRTYTTLYDMMHITVASIVDSSHFTAVLPGEIGAYPDLPTGALSGNTNLTNSLFKCAKGWLTWLNLMLNQRLPIVINSAQAGDKVADNLRRLPREMALWKTLGVNTVVMQLVGINDLTPDSIAPITNDVAQMWLDLQTLMDTIRLAGYRMIVSTCTPVAASESNRSNITAMTLAYHLARWLRNYGNKYADRVLVIDAYKTFIDPTDATGLAKVGYCAQSDHIHGTNVGMYRVARDAKTAVQTFVPGYVDSLPMTTLDSRTNSKVTVSAKTIDAAGIVTITSTGSNMTRNQVIFVTGATGVYGPTAQTGVNGKQSVIETDSTGSFRFQTSITGQAGTVSGTLVISSSRQLFQDSLLQTTTGGGTSGNAGTLTATKIAGQLNVALTAGVTGTADVAAEANGFGNEQTVVVSAAGNGDNVRISWKAGSGVVDNYMIAGRTYVMEAQIRYTTAADWVNNTIGRFQFYAQPGVTSPQTETWVAHDAYEPTSDSTISIFQSGDALTQTYHVRTAPVTVPSGYIVASWNMNFYTNFIGTLLENLTIGISRISVRDVTADGVEMNSCGV